MLYNDIEFVVKRSTEIEQRLQKQLDAEGAGLIQLANDVKGDLPPKPLSNW
jgi:hypothetical protein